MFYLLAFLISAAVVAFVATPLFRERRAWAHVPHPARRAMLLDERDTLLRELKDLEFDRRMGKIDDEDYADLRASTAKKATAVLDALEQPKAAPSERARLEREIEAEVLIARARLKLQATAAPASAGSESWQCAACGRRMAKSDKFCANCGAARP